MRHVEILYAPCWRSQIRLPGTPAFWWRPCCRCTSPRRRAWCAAGRAPISGASSKRRPGPPRRRRLYRPGGMKEMNGNVEQTTYAVELKPNSQIMTTRWSSVPLYHVRRIPRPGRWSQTLLQWKWSWCLFKIWLRKKLGKESDGSCYQPK